MSKTSRREFLVRTSAGLLGAAAVGHLPPLAQAKDLPPLKISSGVELVPLGRTGIKTTVLGLGTGTVGGSKQRALGQDGWNKLVREAFDRGIRYIDTADMYKMHDAVRESIKGLPRDQLFIQTKTTAKNAEKAKADIERFRKELGLETLDTLLMHCMTKKGWGKDMRPVLDVLLDAKRKGQVRAVGVSCHGLDPLVDAVDVEDLDVHLVRINHNGAKMDAAPEVVAPLMQKMYQKGRGIIGMKIFGEGTFLKAEDRQAALKYVLGLGCVHCFTIGFVNAAEIDETLAMINSNR
jgi:predicted aldo/keto reductase-like oxidoreductase